MFVMLFSRTKTTTKKEKKSALVVINNEFHYVCVTNVGPAPLTQLEICLTASAVTAIKHNKNVRFSSLTLS